MAKGNNGQATAPQAGAVQEEAVQTPEEATPEEVATEATAPQAGAASSGVTYIKTIPNKFDVRGVEIPDEEFSLGDIDDMDDDQKSAFDHAVKCGIIKEVE